MKGNPFKYLMLAAVWVMILVMPSFAPAEVAESHSGPPPVEQPLVREGEFAVKLATALGVGAAADEAAAESRLADLGITPRSGWIADYPVTPDISGELRNAVAAAADAGTLALDRDVALRIFDDVLAGLGLPLVPYAGETAYDSLPPADETYFQDPGVVDSYYDMVGPPVVTYYTPPPAYYSLYSWVPYPFWTSGFLFPGFFVLHDFHRTVFVHHREVFVTNHFRDKKTHRIHRVDPVARFKGESFVNKRGHESRTFRSSRVWGSERRFSDGQRPRTFREGRNLRQRTEDARVVRQSTEGNRRDFRQGFDRTRSFTHSAQNVRSFKRSSGFFGRGDGQSFDRARSFTPTVQGTRSFNSPSAWSGPTNLRSGSSPAFNSGKRGGGGNFQGGRGRR